MRMFVLRAIRADGRISSHRFLAESDKDAIATGAMVVMKLAYPNRYPWDRCRIELVNDFGVILQTMEAKS